MAGTEEVRVKKKTFCSPAKAVLLVLGLALTGLGFLGIFLPLLPGTPFFLGALVCFSRCSNRLHDWLFSKPYVAEPIRSFRERGGLPLRLKLKILGICFAALTVSAVFVGRPLVAWILAGVFVLKLFVFFRLVKTVEDRKPFERLNSE